MHEILQLYANDLVDLKIRVTLLCLSSPGSCSGTWSTHAGAADLPRPLLSKLDFFVLHEILHLD